MLAVRSDGESSSRCCSRSVVDVDVVEVVDVVRCGRASKTGAGPRGMFKVRRRRRHVAVGAAVHHMLVGRLACARSTLLPTGTETAGRRMVCLLDGCRCPYW